MFAATQSLQQSAAWSLSGQQQPTCRCFYVLAAAITSLQQLHSATTSFYCYQQLPAAADTIFQQLVNYQLPACRSYYQQLPAAADVAKLQHLAIARNILWWQQQLTVTLAAAIRVQHQYQLVVHQQLAAANTLQQQLPELRSLFWKPLKQLYQ